MDVLVSPALQSASFCVVGREHYARFLVQEALERCRGLERLDNFYQWTGGNAVICLYFSLDCTGII